MSLNCDKELFDHGHSVAVLDACRYRAERFVQAVAEKSGQRVDWHYSGGRANVLYIGDHAKVTEAIETCVSLLSDDLPFDGECGSCRGFMCSDPLPVQHRVASLLSTFGPENHGPYRAGDELPDDVLGVF